MPYALLYAIVGLVAGPVPSHPSHIQQSPERVFFDSLFTELGRSSTVAALPTDRCTGQIKQLALVCESLIAERRGEITRVRDDVRRAEVAMERAVVERPRSAAAWYGLGLVRLQLSRDTAFSRGGALMLPGVSYPAGAANAFVEALDRDRTFGLAAEALASAPIPREGAGFLKERIGMLRKVRGILSPAAMAAAANIERAGGSIDSAVALEERALATGKIDAGLVSLGLARDLYRIGQPARGRAALLKAAANPTRETYEAYRVELQWVAAPAELATWDTLAPAGRSDWLADFWQKRDIAEGRKDGARLIEHYRRIEYAMKNFQVTMPETGRQRALTYTPDMLEYLESEASKCAMRNLDKFPALGETKLYSLQFGSDSPHRYYTPIQDQVDDRGIIWIRHGKPTKTASDMSGRAIEIWQYERPGAPLTVDFIQEDFQGSVGATVLVPTLLTVPIELRNRVCSLDITLCARASTRMAPNIFSNIAARDPANQKDAQVCHTVSDKFVLDLEKEYAAEGTAIAPEAIIRSRDHGRAEIDTATTTDSYRREFTHGIVPGVQIFGLDHADGTAPRLVAAFALPRDQLANGKPTAAGMAYPVSIQLMASDATGKRIDIDTLRTFVVTVPPGKNQYITGLAELPVPPGSYHVSLVLSQTDGRLGIASLPAVSVPGSGANLAVSDLVLGRKESGVEWNSGTTAVPLNPLNTYPKGTPAEIYFQLSGLHPGTTYQTTFEFFRSDDESKKGPRLTVSFAQSAPQARIEVSRTLGLQQLEPGTYRVRLTVNGAGAETTAAGWLTVVK